VHKAKPHLQKLSATGLRVQLTKALATAAALTQAEVEAQCGIKPLAKSYGRPAPPPRKRAIEISLPKALLDAVLRNPKRAVHLPLERIANTKPEEMALHGIANAIDHGDLPAGNLGLLIEHFRGAPFEATLAQAIGRISREIIDEGEEEAVFQGALRRLHEAALKAEIEELTAKDSLTSEEKIELARLLAAKAKHPAE
jgi:DNA primase